jgi:hypothetical protein
VESRGPAEDGLESAAISLGSLLANERYARVVARREGAAGFGSFEPHKTK